ncbi:MAG: hypothetical protein E7256_05325 [Lachnospiraceae bacterium]|nr:hypothetical protein [Lachnospiraceae bacterium]
MPVIIGCTLIFLVWFSLKKSQAIKQELRTSEAFWEEERRSNTIKKCDISDLNYIQIPLDSLPFSDTCPDSIKRCQDQILSLSEKKILNLTGLTNTELKLRYGTANLPFLSEYDTNFLILCRTLNQWGILLKDEGFVEDARSILAYAVSIGSDISSTFVMLGNILKEEGDFIALAQLKERTANLSSIMRDSILTSLREMEQGE